MHRGIILSSVLTAAVLAAVLATLLWESADRKAMLWWVLALTLASLMGLVIVWRHGIATRAGNDEQVWLQRYRLVYLAVGLGWALGGFLLIPALRQQEAALMVIAVVGISAGAMITSAFDIVAALLVAVPALASLLTFVLSHVDRFSLGLMAMVTLFMAIISVAALRFQGLIRRDIEKRREMAIIIENGQRAEQSLNRAQQLAQIGSYDWNPVSGELKWSDEHYRLWGLEPGSVKLDYDLFLRHVHADDLQRLQDTLDQSLRTGQTYDIEHRVVRPDGAVRHMHAQGTVTLDANGQATRMVGTVQDITERKLSDRRIHYLKEAIDTVSEGFVIFDPQDRFVLSNKKYLDLYDLRGQNIHEGMPFEQMLRNDLRRGVFKDAIGREEEWLEERIRRHRNPGEPIEQRLSNGRWIRVTEYRMPDGSITGLRTDITDVKLAQLALQEAKQQADEKARMLRTVLDTIPVRIFWKDRELNYLGCNQLFANDANRHSPQELIGKSDHEMDWRAVAELYRQDDLSVMQSGRAKLNFEEPQIHGDGTTSWLRTSKVPLRDAAGAVIGVLGTYEDITTEKRAAQEIDRLSSRLQLATESAGIGIWNWDIRSKQLSWDKTLFQLFGITQPQFGREQEIWSTQRHPDDVERVNTAVESALRDEQAYDLEFRVLWPDGDVHWLKAKAIVQRDESGAPLSLVGVNWDVTDHHRSEQALVTARNQAEQANRAKSAFLSSMSHELRTPLNAILGFAQVLENDKDSLTADQQQSTDYIISAGYQLLGLVNDVLDLAQIDSGKLVVRLGPVGIAELVSTCVAQVVAAQAERRHISIANNIADRSLAVHGDELRIRQVLINLLSNAVKYNKPQGQVSIDASTPRAGFLRIEVRDTGVGIAAELLPLLFSPFERLEQRHGTISGVGIGLHITKLLVDAMHGSVGVESEPGTGSMFWFELPLSTMAEEPAAPVEATPIVECSASDFVVLYIEDNPVNVKLVGKALEARPGVKLRAAGSAEEGLQMVEAAPPDLILMDIQLPGMDGVAATRVLQSAERTRHIPVVGLSANAMQKDIDRALDAGCSAYLSKPIDLQQLYELIDSYCAAKQG
jgi:PAS domain S-box-containing protein